MAYIFSKRSERRNQLVKKGKVCPACNSTKMELTEPGKDRTTFTCLKCRSISVFTQTPQTSKTKKETVKKLKGITLRDRSGEVKQNQKPKPLENESIYSMVDMIRKAMKDTVILSFDYTATNDTKSARNVEPYKLTSKNGETILFAYDLEGSGIRTFKVKNMSYVEKQDYAYKPRHPIEDKLKEDDA